MIDVQGAYTQKNVSSKFTVLNFELWRVKIISVLT